MVGSFSGSVVSVNLHVLLKGGENAERFSVHRNKRDARRLDMRNNGRGDQASAPGHVAEFKTAHKKSSRGKSRLT